MWLEIVVSVGVGEGCRGGGWVGVVCRRAEEGVAVEERRRARCVCGWR